MVNKQYTVQPARKLPNTSLSNNASVSGHPAVSGVNNLDTAARPMSEHPHQRGSSPRGNASVMQTVGGATYARNIAYVHNHGPSGHNTHAEVTGMFAVDGNANDGRVNNLDKDVAIKDIGRFQYILQMDREMADHPNSPAYRLHPHASASAATVTSVSVSSNNSATDSINNSPNHHNPHHNNHLHQPAHFSFWKAEASPHTPIAYSTSSSSNSSNSTLSSTAARHRRWLQRTARILNAVWLYAKWPLAALLACAVVTTLVYFALVANTSASDEDDANAQIGAAAIAGNGYRPDMTNEEFGRFDAVDRPQYRPIQHNGLQYNTEDRERSRQAAINRTAQLLQLLDAVEERLPEHNDDADENISGRLAIFVQSPSNEDVDDNRSPTDELNAFNDDLLLGAGLPHGSAVSDYPDETVQYTDPEPRRPVAITTHTTSTTTTAGTPPPAATTVKRFRNTQIIEISTPRFYNTQPTEKLQQPSAPHRADRVSIVPNSMPQSPAGRVASTLMFPTRETFEQFGFTSGHQNNFGVPIEEDERMLRMLNEQLLQAERQRNGSGPSVPVAPATGTDDTTDSTLLRARVSPTLPNLRQLAATTERQTVSAFDEGICQSTALPLCRSVLPYDLTSVQHSHSNLSVLDVDHFKYLVESQCSARAHEFICTVLQPECRPERMGILQPCKRSCKAILEPCGHVIAASEFLTAAFDCDSFPDSHDPDVCRDATRDDECLDNEFQCDDRTCIPNQWRCDNIKDCADAEDEIECTFCEHDEFRCPDSDKCIPDKWRCDEYDDCPDAADETDCPFGDESRTMPTTQGHGRTFPYTQELSASRAAVGGSAAAASSTNRPYQLATASSDGGLLSKQRLGNSAAASAVPDELVAEASGIPLLPALSKSLANFQDSKEIMMTSDSETDFKFATRSTVASGGGSSNAGETQPPQVSTRSSQMGSADHVLPCPLGELRCVSGTCITVSQLCDEVADCPDGADEAMCVYKTLNVQ